MLASTDGVVAPHSAVVGPLQVQLPSHMANFFSEVGYLPTAYVEKRSNARMRVRCEAIITHLFVPPFVKRIEERARVLVKDLSRSGVSVLSHQQMWPTETFSIELHRRRLDARVVRCRKLGENCYDIGAVVFSVEALNDAEAMESHEE